MEHYPPNPDLYQDHGYPDDPYHNATLDFTGIRTPLSAPSHQNSGPRQLGDSKEREEKRAIAIKRAEDRRSAYIKDMTRKSMPLYLPGLHPSGLKQEASSTFGYVPGQEDCKTRSESTGLGSFEYSSTLRSATRSLGFAPTPATPAPPKITVDYQLPELGPLPLMEEDKGVKKLLSAVVNVPMTKSESSSCGSCPSPATSNYDAPATPPVSMLARTRPAPRARPLKFDASCPARFSRKLAKSQRLTLDETVAHELEEANCTTSSSRTPNVAASVPLPPEAEEEKQEPRSVVPKIVISEVSPTDCTASHSTTVRAVPLVSPSWGPRPRPIDDRTRQQLKTRSQDALNRELEADENQLEADLADAVTAFDRMSIGQIMNEKKEQAKRNINISLESKIEAHGIMIPDIVQPQTRKPYPWGIYFPETHVNHQIEREASNSKSTNIGSTASGEKQEEERAMSQLALQQGLRTVPNRPDTPYLIPLSSIPGPEPKQTNDGDAQSSTSLQTAKAAEAEEKMEEVHLTPSESLDGEWDRVERNESEDMEWEII